MRPIKLVMRAFGPYANEESIDFRKLEGKNLFLVSGPTGSGKTTIFDAISFAMYGETSGNERSAESLRSQFADEKLLTQVELEFELRGIIYHISRTPRQMKPKTRGDGYTEHGASAELTVLSEGEKKVVTGIKDVNDKIESLMGINAEQFRQIMMIPQGDFRRLLTENSQEREAVLQKIFDTGIYRMIQNELQARAKKLGAEIEKERSVVDAFINGIDCGEHEDIGSLIEQEDKNIAEISIALEKAITADGKLLKELKKEMELKREAIDRTIEEMQKARETNKKLEELEKAKKTLEEELKRQNDMDDIHVRAQRGESALMVAVFEENYMDRKKELDEKSRALANATADLNAAIELNDKLQIRYIEATSQEAQMKMQSLADEILKLRGYLGKVRGIKELETSADKLGGECSLLQKQGESQKLEVKKLREEVLEIGAERDRSKDAQIELEKAFAKLSGTKDVMEKLKRVIRVYEQLQVAEKETLEDEKLLRGASEEYEKKAQKLDEMTRKYNINQAAYLARELMPGKPCPVCGSTHHEKLAQFSDDAPSSEDVEKAAESLEESRREKSELEKQHIKSAQKAEQKEAELYEWFKEAFKYEVSKTDRDSVLQMARLEYGKSGKAAEAIGKEIEELEKLGRAAKAHIEKIDENSKKIGLIEEEAEKTAKTLEEKKVQHQKSVTLLEQIYKEVPEEIRDYEVLEKLIGSRERQRDSEKEAIENTRKDLENAMGKRASLESLKMQLEKDSENLKNTVEKAKEEFKSGASEAGFEGYSEYVGSKLERKQIESYKKQVEEYRQNVYTLKKQIENLKHETAGTAIANIDEMEKSKKEQSQEQEEIMKKMSTVEKRSSKNRGILGDIDSRMKIIGEREKRYGLVAQIAKIANGKNSKQMTFERYVLAAFLEDILSAANSRLKKMSSGRYELLRTEELERKNKQSGLELKVFDNYTGKARHVKTLSGGESFKASLSMALGLSDVVQSHCGGVRLDTMFIDEGFGTLDPESLDSAIGCLIDLQKSGRLVGIISHVPELKERIDARLEVYSTSSGSTTEFLVM